MNNHGIYDETNVYTKILSLEDKVNRLEKIISFENGEEYSFRSPSYRGDTPPHYRSAVHLERATQNFKKDLLQNPHHNKLSRKNYQHIYNRVSVLEKELNGIVQKMNFERDKKSNYSYISNVESQNSCCYDESPYLRERVIPHKRVLQREPKRKHITYDKYIEVIPSESSSTESIEEVIYYVESPTSSSSSSVIVEEYVPKSYTRRSVRKAPIIDVSKSRPRPTIKKSSPKPKTRHRRGSPPNISVTKQPKVRRSKKEKKAFQVRKSESKADTSNEESEVFLVKRSKESPKTTEKAKSRERNEKFFVSRLKRVESSDIEENYETKQKPQVNADKINSKSKKRKSKDIKQQAKTNGSQTNEVKPNKNDKKKFKTKQSTVTITVAHSSFILNDPFVRTIYYDDLYSSEKEKTSYSVNAHDNADYYRTKQDLSSNKSDSGINRVHLSNTRDASIYEMSNSVYSFDPFFKQKQKLYQTDEMNQAQHNTSRDAYNNSDINKSRVHNVNKNDIIVLNDKLNPHQQKFIFKQKRKPKNIGETISNLQKERGIMTDKNFSSSFNESNNSKRPSFNKPIAHSVYLTTVPIYQTSCQNFQSPSRPQKVAMNIGQSNRNQRKISKTLEIPSVVEDDILMNVARKLSPVVAQRINSRLHRSKDEYENKSKSPTKNIKFENSSRLNIYLYNESDNQLKNRINSEEDLILKVGDEKSKDSIKGQHNLRSNANNIFIDVINPSDGDIWKPVRNDIYFAGLKNNSSLQKKSSKSSAVKRIKSISSLTSLFSKKGKAKTSKDKQSHSSIQSKESIAPQHQKRSMIGQERKPTVPLVTTSSEVEDQLNIPLQNAASFDAAQSIQSKKSINRKSISQQARKKSGSHLKSIISRVTSRDKIPKKSKEPARKSLLSKIKSPDKLTKQEQSQEGHTKSQVYSKQGPTLLRMKSGNRASRTSRAFKNMNQKQNEEVRKPKQSAPLRDTSRQSSDNRPEIDRLLSHDSYSGSREYLKNVRSISAYFDKSNSVTSSSLLDDPKMERTEPRLSQDRQHEQEETKRAEMSKANFFVEEENPKISERYQIALEESPLQDSSKNPIIIEEVEQKSRKPLQFCIHFAKEKRSKFESRSILSLDDILTSQGKKVYSTEDLSLSEYAFDENNESYRVRTIHPKRTKNGLHNLKFPSFLNERNSLKYNDCCCKNSKTSKSEQLTSDSSYSVDWHKVANEIKLKP